ncbi:MAG: sugar kinase [Clostridiales bacterium]|jgi:rfaE bifunctional protein kinase chain/domain|nr:sugar kinase [Clostridiales bacterium]OPZ66843.1 MAG: Bifunctional protein HldE [Firmicutes bacterium ADurb.Bin467]
MLTDIKPLARDRLEALLSAVDRADVALIGDLCLDAYWEADMKLSRLSRETPHYPLPIVEERHAPGGAGNVACNLAALKPRSLSAVGVVGLDWRGDLLVRSLEARGVGCGLVVRSPEVPTNAYIKPLRRGVSEVVYEDPRLDFENRAPLPAECESRVLNALGEAAARANVVCVSDQMRFGCATEAVRDRLSELGRTGKTVIVDSRDRAHLYHNVTVKPNEIEASRAFSDGRPLDMDALISLAAELYRRNGRLALITLGDRGSLIADGSGVSHCPACRVEPPIDFCGAGDSFLAALACMLSIGASPAEAAQVATLSAAVCIKKIGTTGTAAREEILEAWDMYWKE